MGGGGGGGGARGVSRPENTDAIWRRAEIASPCVKICVIHPAAGLCVGCNRTADEIEGWTAMTDAERAAIMAALPARASLLTAPQNRPSRRRRAQREDRDAGAQRED